MLAWELQYVVGIDGTLIPIHLKGKQSGKNRSAAIAGGAVATGALIFPTALSGFDLGDSRRATKRSFAVAKCFRRL